MDTNHTDVASVDSHNKIDRRQKSGASYEYETHVNAMTGSETDVEEVFFSGAHCGMFSSFDSQQSPYLPIHFQTSGVGPWQTASVTASPAFPFDG